jgi:hypothetical protein
MSMLTTIIIRRCVFPALSGSCCWNKQLSTNFHSSPPPKKFKQKPMSAVVEKYVPRDGDPVLPLFSLAGKTAIVTGAGAGIGFAVASAFAEAGANVAFLYNSNSGTIQRAAETAAKFGVQCPAPLPPYKTQSVNPRAGKAYKLDVKSQASVEATVDQVVEEFNGRLDVFVANAGIPWTKGPILDANDVHHHHRPPQPPKLTPPLTSTSTTTPSSPRISTASTSAPTLRVNTSADKAAAPSSRPRQ